MSPNGTAAMNSFWFDDMMWDLPAADLEMLENSGTGFGFSDFDWLGGGDGPRGDEQGQ